jgi:hypothetical protein
MDGMSPRKMMASDGGSFGVKSFVEANSNGKSMGSPDATMLSEKQRAATVTYDSKKMPAQGNPDHGRHK